MLLEVLLAVNLLWDQNLWTRGNLEDWYWIRCYESNRAENHHN